MSASLKVLCPLSCAALLIGLTVAVSAAGDSPTHSGDAAVGNSGSVANVQDPLGDESAILKRLLAAGQNPYKQLKSVSAIEGKQLYYLLGRPGTTHAMIVFVQDNSYVFEYWDAETQQKIREIEINTGAAPIAFSPDGKFIGFCSPAEVSLADAETGKLRELNERSQTGFEKKLSCFTPDSQLLLTARKDGSVIIWDVKTGEGKFEHEIGATECLWLTAFPDNKHAALLDIDNQVKVFDIATGEVQQTFTCPKETILSGPAVEIHTTTSAEYVIVMRVLSGASLLKMGESKNVLNLEPHDPWIVLPGSDVIVGTQKGNAYLWNLHTGEQFASVIASAPVAQGQRYNLIEEIAMVDGGNYLLTCDMEQVLKFWKLKTERP